MLSKGWLVAFGIATASLMFFTIDFTYAANCTSGCSNTDSGACDFTGAACPGCTVLAHCSGNFNQGSGNAAYGSTSGNGTTTTTSIVCQYTTPCVDALTFGSCGAFGCAGETGQCTGCTLGVKVANGNYNQCVFHACGET